MLQHKKPTLWVLILASVACMILAVCFLTNPKEYDEDSKSYEKMNEELSDAGETYTQLGEKTSNTTEQVLNEEKTHENNQEADAFAGAVKINDKKPEMVAENLLYSAFSFDASNIKPSVTQANDIISIQYVEDEGNPWDFYLVDFNKDYEFPMTLYHFKNSSHEDTVNIESDKAFIFNEEMVRKAQSFIMQVYGIDCSHAAVSAYGYGNKISVQFNVSEDVLFQVRFYYNNVDPVGVLYFTAEEYAEKAMEVNKALKIYPQN